VADLLYCPLRQSWVAALPEEVVRQNLIRQMVEQLQFPKSHLALEVSLTNLPHLSSHLQDQLPRRRADLIVFSKDLHPDHALYPLLLIECKAVPINAKTFRQAIGYNQVVGALYLTVANQTSLYTGHYSVEKKEYDFFEGLPSYNLLKNRLKL
jgi:hypothetical protein